MSSTEVTVEALGVAVAARVPVLLWGASGSGKTSAIKAMSRELGLPCETVIASIREPSDSVLVHHAGHLLRDHAARAHQVGIDDSSEMAWVAAADAEINDDLVDADLNFPVEPIVPFALECEPGRFAEEYFRHIRDKKSFCTGECGSGAHGRAFVGGKRRRDRADLPRDGASAALQGRLGDPALRGQAARQRAARMAAVGRRAAGGQGGLAARARGRSP